MQQSIIPLLPTPLMIKYLIEILLGCGKRLNVDALDVRLQGSGNEVLEISRKRFVAFLGEDGSDGPDKCHHKDVETIRTVYLIDIFDVAQEVVIQETLVQPQQT
jgi:hypothetical protein